MGYDSATNAVLLPLVVGYDSATNAAVFPLVVGYDSATNAALPRRAGPLCYRGARAHCATAARGPIVLQQLLPVIVGYDSATNAAVIPTSCGI